MSEGTICDARFSKCCGGAFEEFQYCWENIRHPYLSKQRDSKKATDLPDLGYSLQPIMDAMWSWGETYKKKLSAEESETA